MTCAEYIYQVMLNQGIRYVFGTAGTGNLELLDMMAGEDNPVQFIATRHEQVAAHMAEVYGRVSRSPGVCLVHKAAGALSTASAVANAFAESSPMVVIVGDALLEFEGRNAFEEANLEAIFAPITVASFKAKLPANVPHMVRRAFQLAMGRLGPVMLSVPQNLLLSVVEIEERELKIPVPATLRPGKDAVREMIKILREARHPVIWAGGGAMRARAQQDIARLADILNSPVVCSFRRKGAFREDHDLYVGSPGYSGSDLAEEFLREADVLLALGARFGEFTTSKYTVPSKSTRIIQVDVNPEELGRVFPVELAVQGDVGETLGEVLAGASTFGEPSSSWRRPEIIRRKEEWLRSKCQFLHSEEAPVHPGRVVHEVRNTFPRGTIVTTDAGAYAGWVEQFWQVEEPFTYIAPAAGTMGFGFAAALAAQLLNRDRRVVSLIGDGCFMMTMQDFITAVQYNLPVVVVVMNNIGYDVLRVAQDARFGGRHVGTDLVNPDFACLAESFGGYGESVFRPGDLKPALERALSSNLPAILDVHIKSGVRASDRLTKI